jgi:hypothetical protein
MKLLVDRFGLGIEVEILLCNGMEQKIETDSPAGGNPIKKKQLKV